MGQEPRSDRAAELAAELEEAAAALVAVVAQIEPDRWRRVVRPGVWAIGKDAEHVLEATAYHEWIIRLTIGDKVSPRRPVLERSRLTSKLSPQEVMSLLQTRSSAGAALIRTLTVEQLALPTKPPRAGAASLAATIQRVMIGHYETHRAEIETKDRAFGA
jgi:hypothetical protein